MNITEKDVMDQTKGITSTLFYLLMLSVIAMIASPFLLIWTDWIMALKVFASAFVLWIILIVAMKIWKYLLVRFAADVVKDMKDEVQKKSKFQERLEDMAKERGINIKP